MFSSRERSNLLSDVLSLSRAGQLSYQTALDLSSYLITAVPPDIDLLVWNSVTAAFRYITQQLYRDTQIFALWQVRPSLDYDWP